MKLQLTKQEMEDLVSKAIGYRCIVEIVERPKVPGDTGYEPSPELMAKLVALRRGGNLIEAIKLFRAETGCSLRAAKDTMDSLNVAD